MSNGGALYSDQEDRSQEKRLSLLEQKIPVLIKRIQDYDEALNQIVVVKGELESFNAQLKEGIDTLKVLRLNFDLNKQENHFQHKQFEQHSNENKSSILNFSDELKHIKSDIQRIESEKQSFILNFSNEIRNIKILLSEKCDKETFKQHSIACEQKLMDQNNNLSQQIKAVSVHNQNLSQKHLENDQNHISLKACIKDLDSRIESFYLRDASLKTDLSNQLYGVRSSLVNDFDKKLDSLKKELKESPSAASAIKEEILSKFESVSLDGSNAVIKASNSASQVALLEKKIENLYLLIKKYEINK